MIFNLKSCPFCGSDVYLEKIPLWSTHGSINRGYVGDYEYIVKCPNIVECGCSLNLHGNDTIYRSDEEAIKNVVNAWNRRA